MDSQLFDQFLEDSWSAESCGSKSVNSTSDLWPDYLWLDQYTPLAYNFEDLQSLDDLESSSSLSNSSSPPEFGLPSPISDSSCLSVEDQFDQKSLIDAWAPKRRSENSRAKSPCLKRQNGHNLIEKRYRNNLNSKINTLRDSIPSLRSATKEDEEGEDGMDSNARKVQKCNKGIILDKAIEYIVELEKQVESLSKANARLQLMIKGNIPSYLA